MKRTSFKLNQPLKRSRKKPLIVLGVLFAILLGIGCWALYKYTREPVADPNASDTTIITAKDEVESKPDNPSVDDGISSNSTSEQISQNPNLSLSITDFNQSGGMVRSSASISGTTSPGNCVFTYTTTDSRPVVEQVSSTSQAGSQICSATISEVQFDKVGNWGLNVTFFQNNSKVSATRQVTVN
mgnify:CR=1 FL=1